MRLIVKNFTPEQAADALTAHVLRTAGLSGRLRTVTKLEVVRTRAGKARLFRLNVKVLA